MEANCTECGNPIEYEPEQANTLIDCPHCGATTGLPRLPSKPIANLKAKLWLLAAVVGIPLVAVLVVAFLKLGLPAIQAELKALNPNYFTNEFVSSLILVIVGMVLVVLAACLSLAWLLLPVIIWVKLDTVTAEIRKGNAAACHPAATRFSNP